MASSKQKLPASLQLGGWTLDERSQRWYQDTTDKRGKTRRKWASPDDYAAADTSRQAATDPRSFALGDISEALPEVPGPEHYTHAATGATTGDFGSSPPDQSLAIGDEELAESVPAYEYEEAPWQQGNFTSTQEEATADPPNFSDDLTSGKAGSSPPATSKPKGKERADDSRQRSGSKYSDPRVSSSRDKQVASSKTRSSSTREKLPSRDKTSSSSRREVPSSKQSRRKHGNDELDDRRLHTTYAHESTSQPQQWHETVPEEAASAAADRTSYGLQGLETDAQGQPIALGADPSAASFDSPPSTFAGPLTSTYDASDTAEGYRGKAREIPSSHARSGKRHETGRRREEHPRTSQRSLITPEDAPPPPPDDADDDGDAEDPLVAAAIQASKQSYGQAYLSGYGASGSGEPSGSQDAYELVNDEDAVTAADFDYDVGPEGYDELDDGRRTIRATSPVPPSDEHPVSGKRRVAKREDLYQVEPSYRFKEGMVFKVFWPEPLGQGQKPSNSLPSVTEKGIYEFGGQRFYGEIKRFVVVRNRAGFCNCVPIMTYGRQGCTKKGVKPSMHGIVHQWDEAATLLPGEPELGFDPLPVVLDSQTGKLEPTSRVNYAKLQSVEHNVKVLFIGQVARGSFQMVMDAVNSFWNDEDLDEWKKKKPNKRR